jgi:hypothetical protein
VIPSPAPLTGSADPGAEIPDGAGSRRDRIDAALATLAGEELRLTRLGLAAPIARCRQQRRFWTFLRALFSLEDVRVARSAPCSLSTWSADRIR